MVMPTPVASLGASDEVYPPDEVYRPRRPRFLATPEGGRTRAFVVGSDGIADEADLLTELWLALAETQGRCAGYNIIGFDLPMLQRRSLMLDVTPPLVPQVRRYATEPVCDLMEVYFNWGG
jgi:hypothetical protein